MNAPTAAWPPKSKQYIETVKASIAHTQIATAILAPDRYALSLRLQFHGPLPCGKHVR